MRFGILATTLLVLVAVYAHAETDRREFEGGVVYWQYAKFDQTRKTLAELNELTVCAVCPGIDGYLPESITEKVWLEVNGKRIMVPTSMTEDLFNPHVGPKYVESTFSVTKLKDKVIINISGGDGSGSYDASLILDLKNMIVIRELRQYPDRDKPVIKRSKLYTEKLSSPPPDRR